ncbi:MAG: 4-(cytidine 5'-diphospho)-2-C-methyl-D-erythritol kinase [Gaiellaceae bacterium]
MRPARAIAAAKINLALVVGPRRNDGLHEVATVLQRIDLCDRVELEPAATLTVEGFEADTIVRRALEELAAEAGVEPGWRVRLDKEIPVAAGLGGGSADGAAALQLANADLPEPLPPERLRELAAGLGADVPFFLEPGPKLAEGVGEHLTPLPLPQDFWVVLASPRAAEKPSTAAVYGRFDELGGGPGFEERKEQLLLALERCRRPRDLAALPPNDLAEAAGGAPLAHELRAAGAFRADLSGAGPAAYGLFHRREEARAVARSLGSEARTWVVAPVW